MNSATEMLALTILDRYEGGGDERDALAAMGRTARFWDSFLEEVSNRLEISLGESAAVMSRLTRSGCFTHFSGELQPSGRGYLTPMFHRLKGLVGDLAPQ